MRHSGRPDRCIWDGDCDRCGWAFCIATPAQASSFYRREEEECRRRYGRGIGDARGMHKLTAEERKQVKREIMDGEDTATIALKYRVATETIRYYKRQIKKERQ